MRAAPAAAAFGQLAELVAETAGELARLGHDVAVAVPMHRAGTAGTHPGVRFAELRCVALGRVVSARVLQGGLPGPGVPVLSVDAPAYFDRTAVYGDPDDGERYIAFCALVEELLRQTAFAPDVVHGFEWHAAPLLAALASAGEPPARVLSVAPDAPGYRVSARALGVIGAAGEEEVDLLELGRQTATIVTAASAAADLAGLYEAALELARGPL